MKTQVAFGLTEAKSEKNYSIGFLPRRADIDFSKEAVSSRHPMFLHILDRLSEEFVKEVNDTVDEMDALDGTSIRFKQVTKGWVIIEPDMKRVMLSVGVSVEFKPDVPDEKDLQDILWKKGWVQQ